MAAFNFPNSPSVNDIHTENGVSFKWNGTIWLRVGTNDLIEEGNTKVEVIDTGGDGNIRFTTEGTEKVRIIPTGYVGINDSGPNARLCVRGDSDTSDADCQLRIYDTDSTAGSQIPSVSFWGGSTEIGRIRGTDTTGMRFYTANSGTLAERVRITSAGLFGIGDASPTKALTVGTTTPVVLLDDQSSRTLEIRGPSTTHNATILTTSNHSLLLGTNNTERIRIQNSGNVGINDNDASYRLNVAGDNTASNGAGMLKGIIGVQNNTTAFGSSPTAGISFQTKYRSSPDVPLDVAAIYGGKENTSDADKDGYLGFAVREEGGSGTYEKMRLTSSGGLQLNGYNYIESCELRIHANGSIQSVNDAIKFATRFNTDSSLISINHSGGTGSGSRITFTKAVYVLVTVSQDVLGSQDTSYWSQKLVTNGGIQGYHLVRASTHWDNMAWSEGVSIPANGWLEIQWNGTNGMTNVDGTSWSHYHFLVWQNV